MFSCALQNRHAIRVAVVITVSCALALAIPLPHAFWVMVTSLMIVQANIGATLARGWQRTYSTLFGVAIGGVLVVWAHDYAWVFYSISAICAFFVIYFLLRSYAVAIFFGSILVVLFFALLQPDAWLVQVSRFMDTLIGAALALAGSLLLWPISAKRYLQKSAVGVLGALQEMVVIFDQHSHMDQVFAAIAQSRIRFHLNLTKAKQAYSDMTHEIDFSNVRNATGEAIISSLDKLRTSLYGIATLFSCEVFTESENRVYLQEVGEAINQSLTDMVAYLTYDCEGETLEFRQLPTPNWQNPTPGEIYLQRSLDHIEQSLGHLYQACLRFRDS